MPAAGAANADSAQPREQTRDRAASAAAHRNGHNKGARGMFRIIRYFSIASFVCILVAALALAAFFRHIAIREIVEFGESGNVALAEAALEFRAPRTAGLSRRVRESRARSLVAAAAVAGHGARNRRSDAGEIGGPAQDLQQRRLRRVCHTQGSHRQERSATIPASSAPWKAAWRASWSIAMPSTSSTAPPSRTT
ncbi:MAG: hypothetical protein MZW92_01065 [Comamonadaceae bacterium]|nr:hypothetical protein [Comamonadaceae bacterium]